MRMLQILFPILVAAQFLAPAAFGAEQHHSTRQFYGHWQHHQKGGFHFRPYYYKPKPNFHGFQHHYAIHHKKFPNHVFFFNPYKKQFWGRCELKSGGKPRYSMLAEKDRKAKLADIPESAFPEPGELPNIPDSEDGAKLELPPDDLPGEIADDLP